jgi:SWI/SNF-related matrix-associated actin-dependent regulator 1 of chromatin subfamily A
MDEKMEHVIEDLSVMSDFEIHSLCYRYKKAQQHMLPSSAWMDSGKIHALKRMIPEMKQRVY